MTISPQLPLALRPASDQRFDTFVGAEAILASLASLAQGGPGFVLLSGPIGSGKTHLALAAVQAAAAQGHAVQYVPLAQLQGHVVAGLAGLERLALVVLDGLDALLGERADEIALFDFHNRAHASGSAVLYTARETAAALPVGLPDLGSRLAQCIQLVLPRTDDELRRAILQRKAQARGLVLDDAVVSYLLRRVGRDMATLVALLDRIDRASLAEQRRLSVPFVRNLLDPQPGRA